jgi:hypothetical protein
MTDEAILIPLAALAIPIIVAPTAIVVNYLRRRGEQVHRERMHALEVGQPYGAPASMWPVAMASLAVGAIVPLGSFFLAWMATVSEAVSGDGVFFAATVVAVCGIFAGSRLGHRMLDAREREAPRMVNDHHANGSAKPAAYDPDTFDVVSRRG